VFILRTRVSKYKYFYTFYSCTNSNSLNKETKEPIFYVNVKSEELRDILKEILKDVYGVSLIEDKPFVSLFPRGHNITLTQT
jgi:hypothetical protein